ncbi:hypothetical protein HKX48_004818, partial [Thoreauomyces humboldtii]
NTDPETLMRAFVEFCADEKQLTAFWKQVTDTFSGIYGAAVVDAAAIATATTTANGTTTSPIPSRSTTPVPVATTDPARQGSSRDHTPNASPTTNTNGTLAEAAAAAAATEHDVDIMTGALVAGALEAATSVTGSFDISPDADLPTVRVGEGGLPTGIDRLPVTPVFDDLHHPRRQHQHQHPVGIPPYAALPTTVGGAGSDGFGRPGWSRSTSIMDPGFFQPPPEGHDHDHGEREEEEEDDERLSVPAVVVVPPSAPAPSPVFSSVPVPMSTPMQGAAPTVSSAAAMSAAGPGPPGLHNHA